MHKGRWNLFSIPEKCHGDPSYFRNQTKKGSHRLPFLFDVSVWGILEYLDPFGDTKASLFGANIRRSGSTLSLSVVLSGGLGFVERQAHAFRLGGRRVDNIQGLYVSFIRREVRR
jgi:hypothetical protein